MSDIGIDLTANDATAKFAVGTVMSITDSGFTKTYKYVQVTDVAAQATVAGYACYYVKPAEDTTGGLVTTDFSQSDGIGAGILQKAGMTESYYGWIQIKGVATMTIALTAGADGNALTAIGAGADGALDVSGAVTDAVCAYAIDASAKIILCDFPY